MSLTTPLDDRPLFPQNEFMRLAQLPVCLLAAGIILQATAQTTTPRRMIPVQPDFTPGRRIALVIGNAAYPRNEQ